MFRARLLTTGGSCMSATLIRHQRQLAGGVQMISCMLKKLTVWVAERLCCWFLPRILETGSWVSVETYSQAVHPIRIMDYKKSAGHYLQARSVILWMLTLLLPGSWCFYYINNVAGAIHHTDMRLLIMSVPCIFPPFSSKEERGRGRQEMEE